MLVDVHCHLDDPRFKDDLDKVIERAKNAGVKAIISNGTTPKSNMRVLELSKKYDIIKPAFGMYPISALNKKSLSGEAPEFYEFDADECAEMIRKRRKEIIAIGEVGMDFKYSQDKELQKEHFQKMIDLAEEIKKPLIVHSRKAEAEVIEMLSKTKAKVLMHCFSGKKKLFEKGVGLGMYFSIPANILRSDQFKEWVEIAPITQLLTETDSPYLSHMKGERNEPCNVAETVKEIARIKKMEQIEVENNIFMNYQRLFLG